MDDHEDLGTRIIRSLNESTVIEVRIGFAIRLIMQDPDGVLVIECPAHLLIGDETFVVDAGSEPISNAVVLRLLRVAVETAEVESGALRLRFCNELSLVVSPHEDYEAWGWAGDDGSRVICMPGGQIAVWSSHD